MSIIRALILFLFALLAAYTAVSSHEELELQAEFRRPIEKPNQTTVYRNITFYSKRDVEVYRLDRRRSQFYPWTAHLSHWQAALRLAISTGFIGGFFREIYTFSIVRPATAVPHYAWIGICVAILVCALALLLPNLLFEGNPSVKPSALAAVCGLSGCFSDDAWQFVRDSFAKSLKK